VKLITNPPIKKKSMKTAISLLIDLGDP